MDEAHLAWVIAIAQTNPLFLSCFQDNATCTCKGKFSVKIVMLVANSFSDSIWADPRVDKEARSLLQAGHEVIVLGTGKYGQDPLRHELKDGLQIIRRPTLLHNMYTWLNRPSASERPGTKKRQAYYEKNNTNGFKERFVTRFLQFMYDLNNLLFCVGVLPQAVRQKADVYVGHDLNALLPAYLAAHLTGALLVYDSHELWTERVRAIPYNRWHKAVISWVERFLSRRCDLIITVTESLSNILADRYSIRKPLVIMNVHRFVETSPSPEIRNLLTNSVEQHIVVYAGYLDYGKGLEQIIDAAQYLKNAVVAIVGDGVLRPALEDKVKEKQLENQIRFVGWVPSGDVPKYVAAADIGVSPMQGTSLSYYNGLDNKIFHYIMAGIPAAVSNHAERRQLIEHYGIGVVFDEKDPQDIARVINELLSDPVEYEAMRARCLKAAREELSWEIVSRRFVAAVEKLGEKQR